MRKILSTFLSLTLLGSSFIPIDVSAQYSWEPPSGPPSSNNVAPPINVGSSPQNKIGPLSVGSSPYAPGTIFASKGSVIMDSSDDPNDSNMFISFLRTNAYFGTGNFIIGNPNTTPGDGSPKLLLNGQFQFRPRQPDGTLIPIQPNFILATDSQGNASWRDPSTIFSGGGGVVPDGVNEGDILVWNTNCMCWTATTNNIGANLPNGNEAGQTLIWNQNNQEWLPSSKIKVEPNNTIRVGDTSSPSSVLVRASTLLSLNSTGSLFIQSPNVSMILDTPAAPGKVLTSVDNNGRLTWADPGTGGGGGGNGNLPVGAMGDTLWFDGTQWVATNKLRYNNQQNKLQVNIEDLQLTGANNSFGAKPGALLHSKNVQGEVAWNPILRYLKVGNNHEFAVTRPNNENTFFKNEGETDLVKDVRINEGDLFIQKISPYQTNIDSAKKYLPRLCIDKNGQDGIYDTPDDGKVYICPGESGFVYATTRSISDNNAGANPMTINTNTGGGPAGESMIFSWTVPEGVYNLSQVKVASAGGGGGGGGAGATGRAGGGGGGGGGSGYLHTFYDVAVNPGETLCLVVGKGGKGGFGVSQKINRPFNSSVESTNWSDPNNFIRARRGTNGGNSYLSTGNCNSPIQGTGVVVGGKGGYGGDTYSTGPINFNGITIGYVFNGGNPGNGGIAGFFGQNFGNNGQDGHEGWSANPTFIIYSSNFGRGGGGGIGGATGNGNSALGGNGGGNWTWVNVDINKDGSYSIGQNSSAEKAIVMGDNGKHGVTDLNVYPGGGGGGAGSASGSMAEGASVISNITCPTMPGALSIYYFQTNVGGMYFGNFGINIPPPPPTPGAVMVFGPFGAGGLPQWVPCIDPIISYSNPVSSSGYSIDWNGNGTLQGGLNPPESFSITSIPTYNNWPTPSGINSALFNTYRENLCSILPNVTTSNIQDTGATTVYLSGCGGDGGDGGDGFIYIQY